MTRATLLTSLIVAGLLAASSSFAGVLGGNNLDTQGHILNDIDKPGYVGTSMVASQARFDAYHGAQAGNPDLDQNGFAIGNAGSERGRGDQYGWVVLDVTH